MSNSNRFQPGEEVYLTEDLNDIGLKKNTRVVIVAENTVGRNNIAPRSSQQRLMRYSVKQMKPDVAQIRGATASSVDPSKIDCKGKYWQKFFYQEREEGVLKAEVVVNYIYQGSNYQARVPAGTPIMIMNRWSKSSHKQRKPTKASQAVYDIACLSPVNHPYIRAVMINGWIGGDKLSRTRVR